MCIAILNRKNSVLDDIILINCYQNNPDSSGFAYINKANQLMINKGLYTLDEFLNLYKSIKSQSISDVVIHCRIATHGNIDIKNAHPFQINKDIVMVHNGILKIDILNKNQSDTIHFINKYLKNITIDLLKNKTFINMLAEFITPHNKFIFLDKKGKSYIINQQQGIYDNMGNWFSNNSYKTQYIPYNTNFVSLTNKQYKKIKNKICNLTVNDLINIGDDPYINPDNLYITSKEQASKNAVPLYCLDNYEIEDLYFNMYQSLFDIKEVI